MFVEPCLVVGIVAHGDDPVAGCKQRLQHAARPRRQGDERVTWTPVLCHEFLDAEFMPLVVVEDLQAIVMLIVKDIMTHA